MTVVAFAEQLCTHFYGAAFHISSTVDTLCSYVITWSYYSSLDRANTGLWGILRCQQQL